MWPKPLLVVSLGNAFPMDLLAEGAAGGIGGLVGRSVAFPFDTLKVKLATRPGTALGSLVKQILTEEGIAGFYRGYPFSAFEALYQKFLYVLFYAGLKRAYSRLAGRDPVGPGMVLCGYLSDLICVPFSMPLEAMVVQLQSAPAEASKADIVRQALFTYDGLKTSLKSGRAYLVLSFKPGIEFAVFDSIKTRLLRIQAARGEAASELASGTAFGLGALARAIATCVVYPYARGKALSQARLAPTALEALRKVVSSEGVWGCYRGLSMELSRGVTQAAVMFMVMEKVRSVVLRLIQGALRGKALS